MSTAFEEATNLLELDIEYTGDDGDHGQRLLLDRFSAIPALKHLAIRGYTPKNALMLASNMVWGSLIGVKLSLGSFQWDIVASALSALTSVVYLEFSAGTPYDDVT
ncbi:hypothetical protein NP233_g11151 [Leucocoprinus birnbaumii]|uniref:Uncharacterized protein n=1 Tax=Leucocoprinus birnbaumii TaxID=56174 RepID=A0AAD5VH32_9AGAR|nr:hypothetical protein NP233_g11151 [Leucocoprinus birnbaumii]